MTDFEAVQLAVQSFMSTFPTLIRWTIAIVIVLISICVLILVFGLLLKAVVFLIKGVWKIVFSPFTTGFKSGFGNESAKDLFIGGFKKWTWQEVWKRFSRMSN